MIFQEIWLIVLTLKTDLDYEFVIFTGTVQTVSGKYEKSILNRMNQGQNFYFSLN